MDVSLEQLRRVLALALNSPYDGEKEKAVSLLLGRLERDGLRLADLDARFDVPDPVGALRELSGLEHTFEVTLKSREEAAFYAGLTRRLSRAAEPVVWLEGHRLRCRASRAAREQIEQVFVGRAEALQQRLGRAQQQAMAEYQARRRALFQQAIEEELSQMP
ncbi:hypothetical protein [Deinococcus pimensis]|uniref:hypothetical protein n=1 Tax=Deinococcus pimensis TaxID=309888 RepID=UPI000486593E|nr:hypothetical protein [Deinococcus pimensis]